METVMTQFRDANDDPIKGVKIHAGFWRQYVGLCTKVDKTVKDHLMAGGYLVCTGHSLGAAASTIAAVNYGIAYPNQVWHVSFGSPRTGNTEFKKKYDEHVQLQCRIRNELDPVTCLPPPIDYIHVSPEYHLGGQDPCPVVPIFTNVGDHMIEKYVKRIQNI
jgi:predicted lipase